MSGNLHKLDLQKKLQHCNCCTKEQKSMSSYFENTTQIIAGIILTCLHNAGKAHLPLFFVHPCPQHAKKINLNALLLPAFQKFVQPKRNCNLHVCIFCMAPFNKKPSHGFGCLRTGAVKALTSIDVNVWLRFVIPSSSPCCWDSWPLCVVSISPLEEGLDGLCIGQLSKNKSNLPSAPLSFLCGQMKGAIFFADTIPVVFLWWRRRRMLAVLFILHIRHLLSHVGLHLQLWHQHFIRVARENVASLAYTLELSRKIIHREIELVVS